MDQLTEGLLERLLCNLNEWEGCRACATSHSFLAAWNNVRSRGQHRRRLVIGCSVGSKLLEVEPQSYQVVRKSAAHARARHKGGRRRFTASRPGPQRRWNTSMAFAPTWWPNRDLYVDQYKVDRDGRNSGVLQFRSTDLSFMRVFRAGPALLDPEGVAFACQRMFVGSASNSSISALSQDGEVVENLDLGEWVPWSLIADVEGSSAALYVTVDVSYPQEDYLKGPINNRGAILRIDLRPSGSSHIPALSELSGFHMLGKDVGIVALFSLVRGDVAPGCVRRRGRLPSEAKRDLLGRQPAVGFRHQP